MELEAPHICDECIFRQLSLKYLQKNEFDELLNTSDKILVKKGDVIAKQGEVGTHVFFLHLGLLKFVYEGSSKKSVIISVRKGPTFVGVISLLFKDRNSFSVVAIEDSIICKIDIRTMENIFRKHGNYMMDFMKWEAEMLQPSIANFINLAYKNLSGRIAGILLYLQKYVYNEPGSEFGLTRQELAEIASCSVENVIKTLSAFKKEKLIELKGKDIQIINQEKLEHIHKVG